MASSFLDVIREHYDYVDTARLATKFIFLQVGPLCNGRLSKPFTKAECDLRPVPAPIGRDALGYTMFFQDVFEKGFDLLEGVVNDTKRFEDLKTDSQKAIGNLATYFANLQTHKESLTKMLKIGDTDKPTGADLSTALAVHLLGILCPAQSYIINRNNKDEMLDKCRCGCREKIKYGNTGIGNENVWHGFMDIILESDEGMSVGVVTYPDAEPLANKVVKEQDESEDTLSEDMDGADHNVQPVCTLSDMDNQVTAQAIVFSLVQWSRHPNFDQYMIPTILISPTDFRVVMYDAENDLLIRSTAVELFSPKTLSLQKVAVIILWMVLNYRIFCSDITSSDINHLKSRFKTNVYNSIYQNDLKWCVDSFPSVDHGVNDREVWTADFIRIRNR